MELLNSWSAIPANIGIPNPPSFGGRNTSFLYMSEQFMPPVIAGKNSVDTTSSNFFNWSEILGIVLI